MRERDLTGLQFGDLTVISLALREKGKRKYYRCQCSCGNIKDISASHLVTGASRSCGCKVRERTIERNLKHGDTNTRLFSIWSSMRKRCNNKNDMHYGGRGISVCNEWNDYQTFKEWSIASGYDDNLTIERIDVNKGYCPQNCTWIPLSKQAKNKTNSRYVTINGKTALITEWCKVAPVTVTTVYQRIRNGWNVEDALTLTDRRKVKHGKA